MTDDFSSYTELSKRWMLTGICATLVIVLIIPLSFFKSRQRIQDHAQNIKMGPVFVGKENCRDCHRNEYEKWQNSFHDKAMDIADDTTVLGDFDDAIFSHDNVTTRFLKTGGIFCQYHWVGR